MIKKILHYLDVGYLYLKLTLQSQMEYPMFLFSWIISNPIQFLVGAWTLKALIDQFQTINGWSFGQVAFLYGLGSISHGLSIIFFIQTWGIGWAVTEGGFDRYMLRPLNVFFQFAFSYFNMIGITDLIPALIVFTYGCIQISFQWTLLNIVKIILIIAGGTLIRGAVYIAVGSIAFWTKRSGSLITISLQLMEKNVMYPVSIYPTIIQFIFTFCVPLAFISFYPARELLDMNTYFTFPGSFCIWTLGIGILAYYLSMLLFKKGLRHYDSSGS